jgi:hypothetical protein
MFSIGLQGQMAHVKSDCRGMNPMAIPTFRAMRWVHSETFYFKFGNTSRSCLKRSCFHAGLETVGHLGLVVGCGFFVNLIISCRMH